MKWYSTLLLLGLLLLPAGTTTARSQPMPRDAFSVRIEGFVGAKPEKPDIAADWTVRLKGESYELHVSKLQVLTGNIAYYDLITALKPYRPALTITGSDEQLDMFATAPPGQQVSVVAFIRLTGTTRYLMISEIEYVGTPTAVEPTAADSTAGAPRR